MENYKNAKAPLTPLAGPYGHPIHPLLVTLPIGAWSSSLIFDALGTRSEDEWAYAIGAKRLIEIGVASAGLASVFGLLDFLRIPPRSRAWYTGLAHIGLNLATIGSFAFNASSRGRHLRGRDPGQAVTRAQKTMTAGTLGALVLSGWLGGTLTYHYGVRVVDEGLQRKSGYAGATEEHLAQSTSPGGYPK